MPNSTTALPAAFNTAVQGLRRTEQVVDKAVQKLNESLVIAQNNASAASEPRQVIADVLSTTTQAATEVATADIIQPIVDILMAKVAYQANATVVKVTADIERDLLK